MEIDQYISELLYKYDCVILPDFGGFITNYAPAKILPVQHNFSPPSKSIVFNTNLKNNDGLLANHIAKSENISYSASNNFINEFVNECITDLNNGKIVKFIKIGFFQLGTEGNVIFEPENTINYLNDSFGLTNFISHPINRPTIQHKIEKKFIDRKPISLKKRQISKKYKWALLSSLPVIALIIWGAFNLGLLKHINTNQTSLLPSKETSYKKPTTDKSGVNTSHGTKLKKASLNTDPPDKEHIDNPKNAINTQDKSIASNSPKYYIIGGAFKFIENAENFVNDLKDKGYEAKMIGKTKTGLNMVSYYENESKEEALHRLLIIRSKDNPKAWILKK
ncbi:MAG: SPOR domain-containing protein [Bacteroidales bacterium]|nr:SPOR domain-containing protein [Bacteroidales bacterium]